MASNLPKQEVNAEDSGLTSEEREVLMRMLSWRSEEYDVEPIRGPTSRVPDARWIIRVSLGKRSVLLREPSRGHIQLDTGERGGGGRPTTGTSDPSEAIEFAEEWLAGEREDALFDAGIQAVVDHKREEIDIGDVCRLVHRTDLPEKRTWRRYDLACRIAQATLKPGFLVKRLDEDAIKDAIKKRMAGLPELGLGPVGAVTAISNLKDFSTVLTKVGKLKDSHDERLFLNPIRDADWPQEVEVKSSRNGRSRKERVVKKKRDPFTLQQVQMLLEEFTHKDTTGQELTLPPPVDVVDPSGALRLIVMIALFTGRRFEAILQLRVEDLVFDIRSRQEALEEADEESRRDWANHFTHGLINFRGEWDKEGYHWPVPICSTLRQAIDRYLGTRGLIPGPLFPSETNPAKALSQSTISKNPWTDPKTGRLKIGRFDRAWRLAREYLTGAGQDPDDLMPLRKGYKIHRIRACFATLMDRFGYGRANMDGNDGHTFDDHVNYIGGWALSKAIKDDHYIPLDPEVLMGIVEWKEAKDVLGRRARIEGAIATRALEGIRASIPRPRKEAEGAG